MANLDTSQARERSGIRVLGTLPVAGTGVVAIDALYILLASIGNITDYRTNLDFVEHVLTMDTTSCGGPPT